MVEGIIDRQKILLNETQEEIRRINQQLDELCTSTRTDITQLRITSGFNTIATAISLAISQQETLADDLIRLLSSATHGHTTSIIPTSILRDSLKRIEVQLPHTMALPIKIDQENILSIFQLSTLRSSLYDNRLLIEMSIPLISTTTYLLYQSTVVPFNWKGESYVITDIHRLFASDENQLTLIPLADRSEHSCSQIGQRTICHAKTSIVSKAETCELFCLNTPKTETLLDHCRVAEIPNANYVTQVGDSNQYFLHVIKGYPVKINCGGKTSIIQIKTHGYLNLAEGCKATSIHFTITTPRNRSISSIIPSFSTPDINLQELKKPKEILGTKKTSLFDHNSINDLLDETAQIKQLENERERLNLDTKAKMSTNLFIFNAFVFISFAIFTLRKIRQYRNRPTDVQNRLNEQSTTEAATDNTGKEEYKPNSPRTLTSFPRRVNIPDTRNYV